jgi:hypothetical protein
MSVKNFLVDIAINIGVKSARGFWPGKKLKGGVTIYQLSMTLLAALLVRYARRAGPIDDQRLKVLERVQGHFSEHIMFQEVPRAVTMGVLRDMDSDYDSMGQYEFDSRFENFATEAGRELPPIARKEILAHLAMFQRIDTHSLGNLDRMSSVRDEHGLLFGNVTTNDIDGVLNAAAGYTIDS